MDIQDRLLQKTVGTSNENVELEPNIVDIHEETVNGIVGKLCLGVIWAGERYRDIVVSRMDGHSRVEIFKKDARKNPAKAITRILARCVQQIGPFVRSNVIKTDPHRWMQLIRSMTIPDSDHVFLMVAQALNKKPLDENLECENDECGIPLTASVGPFDIDVFELEEDIVDIRNGKYVIRLQNEEPYINALLTIPTRADAEALGATREPNEFKQAARLWNKCLIEINGRKKDESDLDGEGLLKLDSDVLDMLMLLWEINLPGPQVINFIKCPECNEDSMFRVSPESFLSRGRDSMKKSIKDIMKRAKKRKMN